MGNQVIMHFTPDNVPDSVFALMVFDDNRLILAVLFLAGVFGLFWWWNRRAKN
jgi:Na+/H+-dicarboxylate symporter